MHQCEYCCWYNNRYESCDCPTVMRKRACEKAKRQKEHEEKPKNTLEILQ